MIDLHTHILPGLDDGAGDIYDSIEMALLAKDGGTSVIVATPHCNIPGLYENYFGKEYCQTFQKTKEILKREAPGIICLAGMEVYATEELPRLLTEGKIFPLNRTRYVLMEFDFQEDPDFADRILEKVREVRALPLIAHAERYEFVQDDPAIVYRWKRLGGRILPALGSWLFIMRVEMLRASMRKALEGSIFMPVSRIRHLSHSVKGIISRGNQAGEGWFLTGEMLELMAEGVNNSIGDDLFADKISQYKKSNFVSVKKFVERYGSKAEWTEQDIDARATHMAELAYNKIWSILGIFSEID